jgi:Na+/H+-dicarboxylate symporter
MSQTQASKQFSWSQIPLYLQIAIALIFAVGLGLLLGAGQPNPVNVPLIKNLVTPCELVLKALRALATPLILLAVLHSFMTWGTMRCTGGERLNP